MTSAYQNAGQMVTLFGVLGFVLGWCFVPAFGGWIFYTTKPLEFIDTWVVFVLAALFGASFAMIPLTTVIIQRARPSVRYRGTLLALASFWVVMVVLTSVVVSFVTATVHHKTLDIPRWLIPAGLFLVAIFPGITILFAGYWRARRYESCA